MSRAILLLEDGTAFVGRSFGADGEAVGEVVFNTSMSGYQEILTDPSYKGQIVTMTYPLIGNVGVNPDDVESPRPWLEGFIVKEYSGFPSNWRATEPLDRLLQRSGIVAIQGLDTRALTRKLRDRGAMQGILSTEAFDTAQLLKKLKAQPPLVGQDLVRQVTCAEAYPWKEGAWQEPVVPARYHVVAYDFGIKQNILRRLTQAGCRVTVIPAETSAEKVLSMNPDGVLLSNGPGDPEAVSYAIRNTEKLIGKKPLFGICLGHQILGLALGGKCRKLKFGHHGGNQPIMDLVTRQVQITAENHGFAVDIQSIEKEVELTHVNLNDNTVEGMRHRTLPVFSVQYHPEASPGPRDAHFLFKRFIDSFEVQSG
ncbi:MAG: glutamine-hydrolyzing carbamoyl-phosphate synthase small subunit [Nitrospirae bacterium]|nr:glutamine-hydrolyzing carbamoyl-phosphate synthase small subunit [Candidatus Manganitrophaceae bacterium]